MIDTPVRVDHKAFGRQLNDEERRFERFATDALWETSAEAIKFASGTTLFRDQTGRLRKSMGWVPRSFFETQLQAKTPYASFVHNGTPPHVIEASSGKTLAFMQSGSMVFRRSVNHPGTSARPFLQNAANAAEAPLARRLEEAADRAFR